MVTPIELPIVETDSSNGSAPARLAAEALGPRDNRNVTTLRVSFDGGEANVRDILRCGGGIEALRRAFVDCVAMKPKTHNQHGTRQMSQFGG